MSFGNLLLGIWLIAQGLIPLLNIHFKGMPEVMSVMAVATGVLMLLRK